MSTHRDRVAFVEQFVNRFSNEVEGDEPINGADAVEWIGEHSAQFRAALRRIRHPRKARP